MIRSTAAGVILVLLSGVAAQASTWWTAISDVTGPAHCVPVDGGIVEYVLKYHTADSLTRSMPGGGTAILLVGGPFGEFGQWFFADRKDCHAVMGG
jgi:hypothetical protein